MQFPLFLKRYRSLPKVMYLVKANRAALSFDLSSDHKGNKHCLPFL